MIIPDRVPARYVFALGSVSPAAVADFQTLAARADIVCLIDTCSLQQLDVLAAPIQAVRHKVHVVDHHKSFDDIAAVRLTDTTAAAAGVLVAELIRRLNWPLAPAAQALAVAITSDTGWFHFSNTDARCLRIVADLCDAGVHLDEIYQRLFQSDRPQRLELQRRLLGSLQLLSHGRVAVMTLTADDFAGSGAEYNEAENLVNEGLRIHSVQAAALLVETPSAVRVSLRSRGSVDVAALAQQFGGGGHPRAAGLRSADPLPAVKQAVCDALIAALDGSA